MERTFLSCSRSIAGSLVSHSATTPAVRSFSSTVRATSSALPSQIPHGVPSTRQRRCLHSTASNHDTIRSSRSHESPPRSNEDRQTDFSALDVLRNTAAPATSIDACTDTGFALNNNMRISGCGILLVGGEAYRWRPWLSEHRKEGTVGGGAKGDDAMTGRLLNAKGQWEVPNETWGLLDLVWPKPDLLIIGTGPRIIPIAPAMRKYLNGLGIRLDVQDTRNAAAQFNLLATERGVQQVAAALIPMGWREGR
ncbi:hypothetical protein BU23DRAFT_448445 [Bimuria novae-zelandiae CBS 107.79]|uniref:NADH dehydrogenase [ubiquinone] 1 alpha subcomplex assembly factor 3 n=1 Tax=Bimuria novae-zelandiae CBS 107.79 TaxID=1447943 RepID=A0A6A5VQR2_9PLEO|nr:hypothetical protein BU23DRAFT_448445 [Bimuria novae-zelandiae CBS 107.79]